MLPLASRKGRALVATGILLVVAAAGLVIWTSNRPDDSMPEALVWQGRSNYLQSEYAGGLMSEGCHTTAQIAARGLGPVRRVGVVGTEDQMPRNAYIAWSGAMPIVAHGPGLPVFGAFPPEFIWHDGSPHTVFVESSPRCLIEYPPPGG